MEKREKPKKGERYWYIQLWEDDTWSIESANNMLTWDDIYNIANNNFFAAEWIAEENAYSILLELSGQENGKVSQMFLEGKRHP